ncbi:AgmX/PglI C-terminal domain-containing protein [candidate division KSB1 bacterium]|nr:AgmX/PglI C-terminal domain-containing protein [candidate division KSB1 bacterium]
MTQSNSHTASFPRQFRKHFFADFDRDFLLILLITIIVMFSVLLYLLSQLPGTFKPETISKIQDTYAKIVLERDIAPAIVETDREAMNIGELLFTPEAEEPDFGIPGAEGGAAAPAAAPEARLPEAGEMASAGRSRVQGEAAANLENVENRVGNVGYLGLLSSGTGYVAEDYVGDIEDYGDAENERLDEVISSLDAVQVSRGPAGKGWGGTDGKGNTYKPGEQRTMQGSNRQTRALTIDDLIGAIETTGELDFEKIERIESFRKIASTLPQQATPGPDGEMPAIEQRDPEKVQAVINEHRLAIQDCYKQTLKRNPGLKGKLDVRFAINAEGQVSAVEVVNSTIKDTGMITCILGRIKGWNDFGPGNPAKRDEVYRQVFTFGY